MNLVFLVSGSGGNLKFINNCIENGFIQECNLIVIADRDCGALKYSKDKGLEHYLIDYNKKNNLQLLEVLESVNADIIITNIHKILDEELVEKYNGKMINLHYSLLPSYAGLIGDAPVVQAMNYSKFIGVTVHYVERDVDAGEVIIQGVIKNIGEKSDIMNKIFRMGCFSLLYYIYLRHTKVNKLNLEKTTDQNEYIFSPNINFDTSKFDEIFWNKLRD